MPQALAKRLRNKGIFDVFRAVVTREYISGIHLVVKCISFHRKVFIKNTSSRIITDSGNHTSQHPGGPHVGPMNFAVWYAGQLYFENSKSQWVIVIRSRVTDLGWPGYVITMDAGCRCPAGKLAPSHQQPPCWLSWLHCHMSHIAWHTYHVTTIKQTMFERGREITNPLFYFMGGSVLSQQ